MVSTSVPLNVLIWNVMHAAGKLGQVTNEIRKNGLSILGLGKAWYAAATCYLRVAALLAVLNRKMYHTYKVH